MDSVGCGFWSAVLVLCLLGYLDTSMGFHRCGAVAVVELFFQRTRLHRPLPYSFLGMDLCERVLLGVGSRLHYFQAL